MAGAGIGLKAKLGGDKVREVSQARAWGTLRSPEWSMRFSPKYDREIVDLLCYPSERMPSSLGLQHLPGTLQRASFICSFIQ